MGAGGGVTDDTLLRHRSWQNVLCPLERQVFRLGIQDIVRWSRAFAPSPNLACPPLTAAGPRGRCTRLPPTNKSSVYNYDNTFFLNFVMFNLWKINKDVLEEFTRLDAAVGQRPCRRTQRVT